MRSARETSGVITKTKRTDPSLTTLPKALASASSLNTGAAFLSTGAPAAVESLLDLNGIGREMDDSDWLSLAARSESCETVYGRPYKVRREKERRRSIYSDVRQHTKKRMERH